MGYLGHEPLLYRELSGRENLRYHAGLHGVAHARGSTSCSPRSDMEDRADEPVRDLSKGLVQRLAVARAVLHEPALLLLDEPRANLDPAAAELLEPLIGRASGRTRVLVSHDVEGALAEADLALGLRAGRPGAGGRGAVPVIRTARAILRKDLLIELRTKESVPAMVLFSITVYVLFHFGLDRDSLDGELASGVLWVTLLLAAVIGVSRLFAAEREQGGIDGLLLAPVDRTALFVAKAAALFLFLTAVELVAVPAFALLLLGPGLGGAFPELLAVLALGNLGMAAVGALVAALAAETRARELIVPLLLLPLLVPLLIACAQATEPLLRQDAGPEDLGRWLGAPHSLRCGVRASLRSRLRLPARGLMYSKGLAPLAAATAVTITAALALVFFYAPNDADQGFVQKIFYVHVPMAIVALCGFVAGGIFAIRHLRSGDPLLGHALVRGDPPVDHPRASACSSPARSGRGRPGATGGCGTSRCSSRSCGVPPLLRLLPAALLDRGPGPPGALLVGVRDRRGRVRAAELHRRAAGGDVHAPARAVPDRRRACRARCGSPSWCRCWGWRCCS